MNITKIRLAAGLLLFLFLVSCKTEKVPVTRIQSGITIDGKSQDWDDITHFRNDDISAVMAFAETDSALYVLFRTDDRSLGRKLMMGGGGLWWNLDGKAEKQYGIVYPPTRPSQEERGGMMNNRQENNNGERPDGPAMNALQFATPRFVDQVTGEQRSWSEIPGLAASASSDDGMLCIEFRIPSARYSEYGVNLDDGKCLVGLVMDGLDKGSMPNSGGMEERPGGMGMPPGGGPGGRGGGPGGMSGNRGPGTRSEQNTDLFESTKLWLQLVQPETK